MKTDFTVGLSLMILLVWIVGGATGHIPNEIELGSNQSVPVKIFGALGGLSIFRLVILFFQTLIYAAHNAQPESKTNLIVFHLFLGPLISVPYYYTVRKPRNEAEAEQAMRRNR